MDEFHKIKRLPPYVFSEVNQLKAAARQRGEDVVDFGMGNPDQPPPQHVIDKLTEAAQKPGVHRYSNSRGIPGLRRALAGYYQRRFNVDLDPEREAIVTLGSKEGLANLAQAITSPGDVLLVPNPSYPIHAFGFIIALMGCFQGYNSGRGAQGVGAENCVFEAADPLHFGTFGGYWTKTIWFVFGAFMCALSISGVVIYALRLAKQNRETPRWRTGLARAWRAMGVYRWPAAGLVTLPFILAPFVL